MGIIHLPDGIRFDLVDPKPEMVDVHTVAYLLADRTRFGGSLRRKVKVAQHAVVVSRLAEELASTWNKREADLAVVEGMAHPLVYVTHVAYAALHHDDVEAVIGDMPKPLKDMPEMASFKALEERLFRSAFGPALGLTWEDVEHPIVKRADEIDLATQARAWMPQNWQWWRHLKEAPHAPYEVWSDAQAEDEYLRRHYELLERLGRS